MPPARCYESTGSPGSKVAHWLVGSSNPDVNAPCVVGTSPRPTTQINFVYCMSDCHELLRATCILSSPCFMVCSRWAQQEGVAIARHSGCAGGSSIPRCVGLFFCFCTFRVQQCGCTCCMVLNSVRYWYVAGGVNPPQHTRHGVELFPFLDTCSHARENDVRVHGIIHLESSSNCTQEAYHR